MMAGKIALSALAMVALMLLCVGLAGALCLCVNGFTNYFGASFYVNSYNDPPNNGADVYQNPPGGYLFKLDSASPNSVFGRIF